MVVPGENRRGESIVNAGVQGALDNACLSPPIVGNDDNNTTTSPLSASSNYQLHPTSPGKSSSTGCKEGVTPLLSSLLSESTRGCALSHSVLDQCNLRKSSRTEVKVPDQQKDKSFQPDMRSDCLVDGPSHPINEGTDSIRADKAGAASCGIGDRSRSRSGVMKVKEIPNFLTSEPAEADR